MSSNKTADALKVAISDIDLINTAAFTVVNAGNRMQEFLQLPFRPKVFQDVAEPLERLRSLRSLIQTAISELEAR